MTAKSTKSWTRARRTRITFNRRSPPSRSTLLTKRTYPRRKCTPREPLMDQCPIRSTTVCLAQSPTIAINHDHTCIHRHLTHRHQVWKQCNEQYLHPRWIPIPHIPTCRSTRQWTTCTSMCYNTMHPLYPPPVPSIDQAYIRRRPLLMPLL